MTDADRQRMERALAARRPGVTGLGMRFEYPDGTVRDKWGRIINEGKRDQGV